MVFCGFLVSLQAFDSFYFLPRENTPSVFVAGRRGDALLGGGSRVSRPWINMFSTRSWYLWYRYFSMIIKLMLKKTTSHLISHYRHYIILEWWVFLIIIPIFFFVGTSGPNGSETHPGKKSVVRPKDARRCEQWGTPRNDPERMGFLIRMRMGLWHGYILCYMVTNLN